MCEHGISPSLSGLAFPEARPTPTKARDATPSAAIIELCRIHRISGEIQGQIFPVLAWAFGRWRLLRSDLS
jgi:hypothetical protein